MRSTLSHSADHVLTSFLFFCFKNWLFFCELPAYHCVLWILFKSAHCNTSFFFLLCLCFIIISSLYTQGKKPQTWQNTRNDNKNTPFQRTPQWALTLKNMTWKVWLWIPKSRKWTVNKNIQNPLSQLGSEILGPGHSNLGLAQTALKTGWLSQVGALLCT